ncbi:AcrR family transcriptional regulator [Lipingzhangella halophila]|uniref:AcrR family transcriptional regulator n=1 Tax=Lipingzhangella halophila TaxID=1783352 RepID=A0A7W7W3T5_9ACTN|nr:TetR family transcriptional regulator [Lipingzhangella halophila]MBB4933387.1 AcrR family transcriptional regulator [Lipingzhangella halophila]
MSQSAEHQVAGPFPGEGAPVDARTRLVLAAVEAFAAKGFHGTTTRDIAAAAGMSPAAVYVHHRSKEELLYLISRHGHESTLRLVRAAAASKEDPAERLVAVVRAFVVHHAHGHTSARIVNYELSALSPEHQRDIADLRRRIHTEIHELVQAGVDAGVFHTSNPRMTTLALLSLQIDLARWYREEGEWSPEDIAEHYCELALRMVGAR